MKFSLIIPTINRVRELERLFQSLAAQDYEAFEVIVMDQNPDDRLVKLIDFYSQFFSISHIKESIAGQSRARNIGFRYVQGDIVAFPDDDCVYTLGLLGKISRFFDENLNQDGLLTRVYDLDEDKNAFEPCGDDQSQELDYAKTYKLAVSCAIFFRASVAKTISFDERLGPGAGTPWCCGDETDYLFQCLDAGYRFYYDSALLVRHPNPIKNNRFHQQIGREYGYGLGRGYFLATHQLPQALVKFEYKVPYRDALSETFRGNWRRAAYALMKGVGTSLGYQAGLSSTKKINMTRPSQVAGNV